jgi:hypothetical protein
MSLLPAIPALSTCVLLERLVYLMYCLPDVQVSLVVASSVQTGR